MNNYLWSIALRCARGLPTREAEAVCGDLWERQVSGRDALSGILGLVLRRTIEEWRHPEPWLALAGIALLSACASSRFLFLFAISVDQQVRTYSKYGVHYGTGVTAAQDVLYLTALGCLLGIWSWSSAYLLTRLSGRSRWLLAPVFWFVIQNAFFLHLTLNGSLVANPQKPLWLLLAMHIIPATPASAGFLLAATFGLRQGARPHPLRRAAALLVAAATALLSALLIWGDGWYEMAHLRWSEGAWQPAPVSTRLIPIVLATGPALVLPWLACARRLERKPV